MLTSIGISTCKVESRIRPIPNSAQRWSLRCIHFSGTVRLTIDPFLMHSRSGPPTWSRQTYLDATPPNRNHYRYHRVWICAVKHSTESCLKVGTIRVCSGSGLIRPVFSISTFFTLEKLTIADHDLRILGTCANTSPALLLTLETLLRSMKTAVGSEESYAGPYSGFNLTGSN